MIYHRSFRLLSGGGQSRGFGLKKSSQGENVGVVFWIDLDE